MSPCVQQEEAIVLSAVPPTSYMPGGKFTWHSAPSFWAHLPSHKLKRQ